MTYGPIRHWTAALMLVLSASTLTAQQQQAADKKPKKEKKDSGEAKPYVSPPVFTAAAPLEFTLIAPFRQVKKERTGKTTYRNAEIRVVGDSGTEVRIPLRVRGRGIWRRKNCDMPPLWLNLSKDSSKKTPFKHLDKVRLTNSCRDNDEYEQYVLSEFQLYRVQKLLTHLTFNARLARVTYIDAEKKDTLGHRWGFLLEDDPDFAQRIGGKLLNTKGATGSDLDGMESAIFGVFQYMIGNTDFSIGGLHNVALLAKDTAYYAVAYDYDWSGAVNTRYSFPDPRLRIRRTTDRIMRGYCTTPENYEKTFALFKEKKDAIYALYRDSLASAMKPDQVAKTLKYFDDFYSTINDQRQANRFIVKECLENQA